MDYDAFLCRVNKPSDMGSITKRGKTEKLRQSCIIPLFKKKSYPYVFKINHAENGKFCQGKSRSFKYEVS